MVRMCQYDIAQDLLSHDLKIGDSMFIEVGGHRIIVIFQHWSTGASAFLNFT
jgi:hypothetical protein